MKGENSNDEREQRNNEKGKKLMTDKGRYLEIFKMLPNKTGVTLKLHLRAPTITQMLRFLFSTEKTEDSVFGVFS